MDLQAVTERRVLLVYPVCQDVTVCQDTPDQKEKREILESWVDLERLGRRAIEDCLDYLGLLERPVWLDFLDPWDQWAHPVPQGLRDLPGLGPDLTIWKKVQEGLESQD